MTRSEFRSWRAFSLVYPLLEALPQKPDFSAVSTASGIDSEVLGAFTASSR